METKTGLLKSTPITIAAMIIIISAIMYAEALVNPLLMAFFISIICTQPIAWLKKKGVPSGLAIFIAILFIFLFYGLFIQLISSSLSLFLEDAPKYQQSFSEIMDSLQATLNDRGINIVLMEQGSTMDPSRIMEYTASMFSGLNEMLRRETTIIFLTIFLLAEVDSIELKMKVIAKNSNFSLDYLKSIAEGIRHYLSIKTATSLITGVLVTILLSLIGVDYVILWGLLAFLLNFIPTIGSIIAAILAILISIIELGFPASFLTIGVYITINMIIGNIVEPKIMGKGLGLSAFIVFFGLIFWGYILGYVGMFLSVPLMMVIKIILENNPQTKWIAALLGTKEDAEAALN